MTIMNGFIIGSKSMNAKTKLKALEDENRHLKAQIEYLERKAKEGAPVSAQTFERKPKQQRKRK